MADNRMVHLGFWNDKYIQGLEKDYKLIYLYLLTNERTLICGLYEITEKTISNETELNIEIIKSALHKFTTDKKMFYDNGLIFIPKYAFYQSASKLGRFNEHLEKTFRRFSTIESISFYAFCIKYKDIIKHLFSKALLNSLQTLYKDLMNNEQCIMGNEPEQEPPEKKVFYPDDFETFYKTYDYDCDKPETYRAWQYKNPIEREKICKIVDDYVLKVPKEFRVKPEKYIAKVYKDEIIDRRKIKDGKMYIKNNGTEYEVQDYTVVVNGNRVNLTEAEKQKCYFK